MQLNRLELQQKVRAAMDQQVEAKGHVAPIDVLQQLGWLSQRDYADWRMGRVRYLEQLCHISLGKLSTILHEMRSHAQQRGWKASRTDYRKWGKGVRIRLRFSKSGNPELERWYATHFVGVKPASGPPVASSSPPTCAQVDATRSI